MPPTPLLVATDLTRYYGAHRAIEGFSLELSPGEVLGLLGPNGAGKTTTLNMLCGCLAPSRGRVLIDGIDLLEHPRQAKRRVGYLPEQPPLYAELTVDEYLGYCARLRGLRRAEARAALRRVKQRTGLDGAGRALIGTLSKGFRQRVGLAQALIHQPPLIVLDEPTAGLDPLQIEQIRALIEALRQDHAIIFSTHILPEVQRVCDRVCIIADGRPVYAASLAGAVTPAVWRASFKNPPPAPMLERIRGLLEVQELGAGHFILRAAPQADIADALVEAACTGGWGLRRLCPEQASLERIFLDALHAGPPAESTP